MKPKILHFSCLLLGLMAILASCNRKQGPVTLSGYAQGTTFVVRYFGTADSTAIVNGIDSIFNLIDHTVSLYDSNSILVKVNRNEPVTLNPFFITLFNRSMEISKETGGAFDITVGPLVKAYGFYRKNQQPLDETRIDSLRKRVGYDKVALDSGRLVKQDPGALLDFNAIAQGYTVDLVASLLEFHGIRNYIVEIGGEVRVSGNKPDGAPWVVGIEKPASSDSAAQEVKQKIALAGLSVATSGNSRKFFVRDGVKYSHTIDPQTGSPVCHSLLSVTVIASDCMTADAYATACMVMGMEKALAFLARHPGTEGYFIYSSPSGEIKEHYTPGFGKFMLKD